MAGKKKVLVLTTSFPRYNGDIKGGGGYLLELYSHLILDFDVFILAPLLVHANRYFEINGIKVHRFRFWMKKENPLCNENDTSSNLSNPFSLFLLPLFLFSFFIGIIRQVKKYKIDVIHAHWLLPSGLLAVVYKLNFNREIKIVISILGSDINRFNGVLGTMLKKIVLKHADVVTVVSNPIKEKVIELGREEIIYVFPMGIDTDRFNPRNINNQLREEYDITGTFILYIGHLFELKGLKYLLESVPLFLEKDKKAKLVIVGNGNYKQEMEMIIRNLEIKESVVFAGTVSAELLPSYYASADMFVLPSLSEGWPVVVMEALCSGTKVIASDIPVFKEYQDRYPFLKVVQARNAKAISTAVIEYMNHKNTDCSSDARIFALDNFDWAVISDKYKKMLNSILD